MCDLLNRIWSRPRDEWTRVLHHELPSLADEMVEVLRYRIPGFAALLADTHREKVRWEVEQALRAALGYLEADGCDADESNPCDLRAPLPAAPEPSQEQVRADLFTALTEVTTVPEASLAALARGAEWALPERIQAVVLGEPGELSLPQEVFGDLLAGSASAAPCLLIPDPSPGTSAALKSALRGRTAAVGHVVPLADAPSSLHWARRLLTLGPPPSDSGEPLLFVDDHLSTLLLLQDESLVRALTERWLRPLAELTPRQSERLEVTLLAWLEGGGAPEAAKALQVHPQTVHYRLRQLEKLFGPALRDPRARLELEMTLHSRRLLARMRNLQSRAGRRGRAGTVGLRHLGLRQQARVNGR